MTEANPENGYYQMGSHTLKIPMALFAQNRRRLVDELKKQKEGKLLIVNYTF